MPDRLKKDLTSLGDVISSSLDRGFLGLAKEMVKVFEVWEEAVGEFNARRTRPESIKDGRLRVFVESPVWIDRLSYFKAEFIENINEALGAPLVTEIVFRVGPITSSPDKGGTEEAGARNNPEPDSISDPKIQSAVAGIKDPELKKSLAALLARQETGRK